ncbi:uncharacterized protein LOC134662692 [Cydia amplana]|uniref:uncharacterized protein LOC134662692 n=1 Tax=Cydia amplana TaxID=1869771 RepID=UPI002FE51655
MLGPSYQQEIPASKEMLRPQANNRNTTKVQCGVPKRNSELSRFSKLCQFFSIARKIESQGAVKILSQSSKPAKSTPVPNPTECAARISLVVEQPQQRIHDTLSPNKSLSSHRRFVTSMGGPSRQHEITRTMDLHRIHSPFEYKRNAGSVLCPRTLSPIFEEFISNDTKRQQIGGCISEERRGNSISCPDGPLLQNIPPGRSVEHPFSDLLPPREVQLRGRSSLSPNCLSRMASSPSNNRENIRKVGHPDNRFVRVSGGARSPKLCITRCDRSPSPISQCFQSNLALPSGMAIPTAISNTSGTSSFEYSRRDIFNHSPAVAEGFLEARPQKSIPSPSVHDIRPRPGADRHKHGQASAPSSRNDPRSMEMWGWAESVKNWSVEQKCLLLSSWLESSRQVDPP